MRNEKYTNCLITRLAAKLLTVRPLLNTIRLGTAFLIAVLGMLLPESRADCCRIILIPICPPGVVIMRPRPRPNFIPPNVWPPFINNNNNNTNTNVNVNVPVTNINNLQPISHPGNVPRPSGPIDEPVYYTNYYNQQAYFKEENQDAMIAWNGHEQIMILQTNDEPVQGEATMMSMMPLPGRPIKIERAKNEDACTDAFKLIKDKLQEQQGYGGKAADELGPSAVIGVHDFLTVRLSSIGRSAIQEELGGVLRNYLADRYGQNAVAPILTDKLLTTIDRYRGSRYEWFVLDLVVQKPLAQVATDDKPRPAKIPVLYHVESSSVYYPLVISGAGGTGYTNVQLAVFSPTKLVRRAGPQFVLERVGNEGTAELQAGDLARIDTELPRFFGGDEKQVKGRIIKFGGQLDGFHDDFIMQPPTNY